LEKGDNVFYKLGITRTPPLMRDNTDRNRTSPFAFTGNKFEYRAVGGSANSASPMIILNTIVANQLQEFKKELEARLETGEKKELAIVDILKDYYRHSKRILFQGNGYSEEWIQEAAERGLTNIASTPIALAKYIEPSAIAVLEKMGVLTEREVHARYEIELENYIKKVQIESRVMGDLALNHVVSTTVKYQFQLAQTAKALVELELIDEAQPLKELIKEVSQRVSIIKQAVDDMTEARKKANNTEDIAERAILYGSEVKDYFDKIRYEVDKLELLIDDEDWPLVKYREMLFVK
jgi:glutamine synthetase